MIASFHYDFIIPKKRRMFQKFAFFKTKLAFAVFDSYDFWDLVNRERLYYLIKYMNRFFA